VPSEGHFEQIEIATDTEPPGFGDATPPATVLDSAAVATEIVEDSLSVTANGELGQAASDQTESDPDTGEAPVQVVDQPEVKDQETVAEIPAEVPEASPAVFDMGPYREPVGDKGWALHVYSLPDSSGTVKQVRELDRRGFQSAVRMFDLGEKGRWRRIYLGSFASRTEAKQAMPALLEKLRVDWAKPEIFKTSAPE
jgi:cell division septation protein DedD